MSHKTYIFAASAAFIFLSAVLFINHSEATAPSLVKASSHILSETSVQFESTIETDSAYTATATATALPKELPKTSNAEVAMQGSSSVPSSVPNLVSPAWPTRLSMPSIGISAPIIAMGLTNDGKMAVPDNFTEIGWYQLGTIPGNQGSAVLGAHVDNGGRISGVFKNLKDLKIGDVVTITDSNGQQLQFKVVDRKIYDYRHQDTAEIFGDTGKKRLNLITCHGTFMPSENTYDQRLIVFTELMQ